MRRLLPVLQGGGLPGPALAGSPPSGAAGPSASVPGGWPDGYGPDARPRVGFFTDTTLCIGCKACEVACKEWNELPVDGYAWTGQSYDNTGSLGANTWRHVAFIEQDRPLRVPAADDGPHGSRDGPERGDDGPDGSLDGPDRGHLGLPRPLVPMGPGRPAVRPGLEPLDGQAPGDAGMRWLMSSDVCKHCTDAACLDVCPTGALFRTEFGTVVVQEDVCNGCGYCVSACPFGVIDRRAIPGVPGTGVAQKCTLCYDRALGGLEPACAKACPTASIQWGELGELRERAARRLERVVEDGYDGARLYGDRPDDGVGGFGAFFLLLDDPEVYGLPPAPVATTRHLGSIWGAALAAAGALVAGLAVAAIGGRR